MPGLIPEPAPSRIPWLQGRDMQAQQCRLQCESSWAGSWSKASRVGRASISGCPRSQGGAGRAETSFLQMYFSSEDNRLKNSFFFFWRILKTGYFKFGVVFFFFNFSKVKNWNLCIEYRISEMWVFDHVLKAVTDSFQGAKEKHMIVFSFSSHQILAVNVQILAETCAWIHLFTFQFCLPFVLLSRVALLSSKVIPRVGSEEMFILGTQISSWALHLPRTLLDC